MQNIPLSLYIHIPWCVKKCPYCDFNSHEAKSSLPEDSYVNTLLLDLEGQLSGVQERSLISIFFGGGTPSLFSAESIKKILAGVNEKIPFSKNIEITLEANPGTMEEKKYKEFCDAGINRLSLGIQSLQDEKLKKLGRIHGRDQALSAIETAKNAGFNSFNLDLMHGLPGQTIKDALEDLNDALFFNPPHLSWYQLTLEPNTLFYHQPPTLPIDDVLWEIQEQGFNLLRNSNFVQYEISAFAKNNFTCVHNQNYWEFGDYLGIGAGAHSKITDLKNQSVHRYTRPKHPKEYLAQDKKELNKKICDTQDLIFEFMLNTLRLTAGVPLSYFGERTGLPLTCLEKELALAQEKKLLLLDNEKLQATELGKRFLNDLISLFLKKTA